MWALSDRDFWIPTVETLVNSGADVNARDNNGRTPLMFAAAATADALDVFGLKSLVDILIKAGADLNAVDNTGKTVLMWAEGIPDLVQVLEEAGAK